MSSPSLVKLGPRTLRTARENAPSQKLTVFFYVCFLIIVALETDSAYNTVALTVVLQCYMEQADIVSIITDVSFR